MATWKKVILAGDSDLGMPTSGGTFSGDVTLGSNNLIFESGEKVFSTGGYLVADGDAGFIARDSGVNKLIINGDNATFSGHIVLPDASGSGGVLKLGASEDIQIYHDGSHSYLDHLNTGDLYIRNLRHGGSIKFHTEKSDGTQYTPLVLDDAGNATFSGQYLVLNAGGTNAAITCNSDTMHFIADTNANGGTHNPFEWWHDSTTIDGGTKIMHLSSGADLWIGNDLTVTGAIGSGGITATGDIQAPGIYVGSTNTSYDFYNNGTTYLNGATYIDANLTFTTNSTTVDFTGSGPHTISGSGSGSYYNMNNVGTITPNSDSGFDLGKSTHYWDEAFIAHINSKDFVNIQIDDAEQYFQNTAGSDYWRLRRDASNNFILDHYDGSSTGTAMSFDSSENLTLGGNVNVGGSIQASSSQNVYLSLDTTQTNGDEWKIFNVVSGSVSQLQFKNEDTSEYPLVLQEGNKVGINTVSPTHVLDIYGGSLNATGGIKLTNDDTGVGATDGTTLMVEQNSGRFILRQYENANILIRTNDTDAIEIDNSQNSTFSGTITSKAITINEANDGGTTELIINNSASAGSTDEKVGIRLRHASATGAVIFSERTEDFSSSGNQSANLCIQTTKDGISATRMVVADSGTTSFYGNTGVSADSKALRVGHGNDYTMMHDGTHTYVENLTGELRTYQSSGDHYSVWTKPSGGSITKRLNIAPDGVITAYETLLRSATNNSAGTAWTAIGDGNIPHISIQNASTTNNTMAGLFFKDDQAHRAGIHAKFVNHTDSSEEAELIFSTASSGDTRERLTIKGNGDVYTTGSIYVPWEIVHTGDTDTRITFDTDVITLRTGGNYTLKAGNGLITCTAPSSTAMAIELQADGASNHADNWRISSEADNMFEIQSKDGGSFASVVEWSGSDKAMYAKGNVHLSGTTLSLAGTSSVDSYLRFDGGGGDTYLHYNANDMIDVYTGGDIAMRIKDDDVEFNGGLQIDGDVQIGKASNDTSASLRVNTDLTIHRDSTGGAGDCTIKFDRRHDGATAYIVAKSGDDGAYATNLEFITKGHNGSAYQDYHALILDDEGVGKFNYDLIINGDSAVGKTAISTSGSHAVVDLNNSSGTHKVRINAGGDSYFNGGEVGIGISSPNKQLTVALPQTDNTIMEVMRLTTTGSYDSGGSSNAGASLSFGQYADTYPDWQIAQIAGIRSGNNWGGALVFHTNSNSAQGDLSEKMRITSAGNVGIGVDPDGILFRAEKSVNGNWAGLIKNTHSTNGYGLKVQGGDDANVESFSVRDVSNTTLFNVLGSGNVGIGTTNPSGYHSSADNLVLYESANAGMTIATSSTGTGSIFFADSGTGDEAYKGAIEYVHGSTNELQFRANSVKGMTLDASKNLTIGGSLDIGDDASGPHRLTIHSRYESGAPSLHFRTGHPNNANVWTMGKIQVFDDGNYNGSMRFYTSTTGLNQDIDGGMTEALEIDSSQNSYFSGDIVVNGRTKTDHTYLKIQSNADNNYDAILQWDQESTMAWQLYNDGSDSDKLKLKDAGGTQIFEATQDSTVVTGVTWTFQSHTFMGDIYLSGGDIYSPEGAKCITVANDDTTFADDVAVGGDLTVDGAYPFMINASSDWKGASTEKNMPFSVGGAASASVSTGSDLKSQYTWVAPFATTLRALYVTSETAVTSCQFKVEVASTYSVYVNSTATTTTTYTKSFTTGATANISCGLSIAKGNAIRFSINPNSTNVDQFLVTFVFE